MIKFNLLLKSLTSKSFTFRGKASRKEYLYVFIFFHLLVLFVHFLGKIIDSHPLIIILCVLCAILGLYCIIPFISVNVRRLHDINKSGWWLFFAGFIPFIGMTIVFIISLFLKGTPGPNRYGEPPA